MSAGGEQFTVALQGFSEFERNALASFFRLASERSPGYLQVDRMEESHFVIADADHAASLRAVQTAGRGDDTVFVGQRAPQGAASWLRRPIEPTRIVRELDALVALRRASVPVSLSELAAQAGDPPARGKPVPATRPAAPRHAEPVGPDVLVAEDSRIARRFLQLRLQRLGYRVHLASDGDEALEQFTQRGFEIVFLDVELGSVGSIDGFSLCQHLKTHPDFAGGRAPKVVMVTGRDSATDRVRGQLAGCDAYLTKPLLEPEFMQALHRLDPGLRKRIPAG
jgi:two-component system, cell cycle response regulator